MLNDLLNLNVLVFFVVFARVGMALAVMPGFSSPFVNVKARLFIALGMALVLTPSVAGYLPPLPQKPLELGVLVATESVIGALLGVIGRILISALHTAGTVIAFGSGLANAMVFDPISEVQGSILSGFFTTTAMVIIFVSGLHHLMLRSIVDSYVVFTPGAPLPVGDMSHLVARKVADSFGLGVQLATPFVVISLTFNLVMGVLSRLMPTLQVFFLGLPLQHMFLFASMGVVLSGIMLVFINHFAEDYGAFLGGGPVPFTP